MKVVGLTGGIGSGKTTVAKLFESLNIPVYIADIEAKRLMNTSKVIRRKLIMLFGDKAYIDNQLNKTFIASKIFNNDSLLTQMNAIVHPKVGQNFKRWLKKQKSAYVVKESAIIFEHQKQSEYDFIITVTASTKEKIARVLKRDNTTEDKIMDIIKNQMSDKEKAKNSDFVIINDHLKDTETQVIQIHKKILQFIGKS